MTSFLHGRVPHHVCGINAPYELNRVTLIAIHGATLRWILWCLLTYWRTLRGLLESALFRLCLTTNVTLFNAG